MHLTICNGKETQLPSPKIQCMFSCQFRIIENKPKVQNIFISKCCPLLHLHKFLDIFMGMSIHIWDVMSR